MKTRLLSHVRTLLSTATLASMLACWTPATFADPPPATPPPSSAASVSELLEKGIYNEEPKGDIDSAITNICRCGTYQQVRTAIHAAASA